MLQPHIDCWRNLQQPKRYRCGRSYAHSVRFPGRIYPITTQQAISITLPLKQEHIGIFAFGIVIARAWAVAYGGHTPQSSVDGKQDDMNTAVTDYLYELKRADSDLAFDGHTKLITRQTTDGNECILISCEKKSITNAMDTIAVAEREVAIHDEQIAHTKEVDGFLRSKFSNRDLYQWMQESRRSGCSSCRMMDKAATSKNHSSTAQSLM